MEQARTDRFKTALLLMAATGLIVGLAFYLAGQPEIATLIWMGLQTGPGGWPTE